MEHRKTRLLLPIICLGALLILASCKKSLEQPELSDPIYNDFLKESELIKDQIEVERKSLAEAKESLDKTDLTAGDRHQIEKQISSSDKKIRLMEQDQTFYQIRARSRKIHDREVYPERFEKNLPWPDPEEIAEFETNRRLNAAPKNWPDHLPKSKDSAVVPRGTD